MWSQYDEDLSQNPFFKEIKENHSDIIEKSQQENWIVCVPRNGTLEYSQLQPVETVLDHILIRDNDSDDTYYTLSKKRANVSNKSIKLDTTELLYGNVEILFEETFYTQKDLKFTVWCIDRPLFLKCDFCASHETIVLQNLHDCIDFLWAESSGHEILENINKLTQIFWVSEDEFEIESLQTQKELIGNLYSQCLQACLKHGVLRDKSQRNTTYLDKVKIAVETYMQYCLGKKLVFSVNTLQSNTDSLFNKIVRNSSDLQLQDLDICSTFCELITLAKCELSKLNNYVTVLDKINCLKRTFNLFYEHCNIKKDIYVTADELLEVLVFLITKININNWSANIIYLKEFRFSSLETTNQSNFFIATFEAALEFIKSNEFLRIVKNCSQNRFDKLDLKFLTELCKNGNSNNQTSSSTNETKLCHPLCACDKCEFLMKNNNVMNSRGGIINEKGQNLLIAAVLQDDVNTVECILSEFSNINDVDYFGKTALHYAASKGFQDILFLLLNFKANVNAADNDKNTPLHLATEKGHENCVKALLYSPDDIEINLENAHGETPLFLATKWGYFDIVKLLLENGASVCVTNKRNQTVFNLAPNYYIFKLFQNFRSESKKIAKECMEDIVVINDEQTDYIVDCNQHGVRPKNVEEIKKLDLLLKAIENNDLPLTCFYLGFSISNDSTNSLNKCHPLCACEKCDQDQENVSQDNPVQQIHINICNSDGYTPLHLAAKYGRTEILRRLLDCGALPNIKTYKTLYTPLHIAVINQRIPIIRELLKSGSCLIDPQDFKGHTPLFYACLNNDVKIAEILLSNGADCTKKNYEGSSILQEVENRNQYRIFKLLKETLKCTFEEDLF